MARADPDADKVVPLHAAGAPSNGAVAPGRRSSRPRREVKPAFAEGERYAPGYVIASKYRLDRVIGEGGMGSVWRAHNLTLDVDVAIKLIRRDVASGEASERLLREARAAARLDHASIVRVYDFGETEHSDPFIVMEVVRGESLADVIDRKGRLPATTAVQMLLPIIDALSVAHTRGIIHRDVKPDNIILMTGDKGSVCPKLVDFGVAKDAPRDWGAEPVLVTDTPRARRLTQAGAIVGSPDYMSPEQATCSSVNHRADIWAVCVVLYEAMCGQRPFQGPDLATLALAIVRDAPTPVTEHGAGDEALWSILARALHKDPHQRWPSMHAMGGALAEWLTRHGIRTDVTGAALEAHWLEAAAARPLAEPPRASTTDATTGRQQARHLAATGWVVAVVMVFGLFATLGWWVVARAPSVDAGAAPDAESRSDRAVGPGTPQRETPAEPIASVGAKAPPSSVESSSPRTLADGEPEGDPSAAAGRPTSPPGVPPRSHVPKREQAVPSDPGF